MDEEHSASQVSWGARINTRERQDETDCPAWVKPGDQHTWVRKGIIIWQAETKHIVRLSASSALKILEGVGSNDAWKERGIVVTGHCIRPTQDNDGYGYESAPYNPIHLSPRQTESLLRLLEK